MSYIYIDILHYPHYLYTHTCMNHYIPIYIPIFIFPSPGSQWNGSFLKHTGPPKSSKNKPFYCRNPWFSGPPVFEPPMKSRTSQPLSRRGRFLRRRRCSQTLAAAAGPSMANSSVALGETLAPQAPTWPAPRTWENDSIVMGGWKGQYMQGMWYLLSTHKYTYLGFALGTTGEKKTYSALIDLNRFPK